MIADSLTNNNLIKSFQLVDYEFEQSKSLSFLKQLYTANMYTTGSNCIMMLYSNDFKVLYRRCGEYCLTD